MFGSSVPAFGQIPISRWVSGVWRSSICSVLGVSEERGLASIALTVLEISIFSEADLISLLSTWCWGLWLWLVECYLVAVSKAVVYGSFEAAPSPPVHPFSSSGMVYSVVRLELCRLALSRVVLCVTC